jgi:glutathione synthase/RimK-type ligase-like ATP-grasp enzyme
VIIRSTWGYWNDVPSFLEAFAPYFDELNTPGLVVKPVIGANGEDEYRISKADPKDRLDEIAGRFRGRACMNQEFMAAIFSQSEYSLFFSNGEFSHAIVKVPAESEFRSQEEHGAEIRRVVPQDKLLARGREARAAIAIPPLYARIDFVRDQRDDFVVMEMELIEPSMYRRMDSGAPARFARAIDDWFDPSG